MGRLVSGEGAYPCRSVQWKPVRLYPRVEAPHFSCPEQTGRVRESLHLACAARILRGATRPPRVPKLWTVEMVRRGMRWSGTMKEAAMADHLKRIEREATPEEIERHRVVREQVKQDLPELRAWARAAAARHQERIAVGTILSGEETKLIDAIDDYAAKHSLAGRSAVVREALAQLLGVDLAR